MSKYSDFLKQRKENNLNFFFGEGNFVQSAKRFKITNHIIDNDNIVLVTSNVQYFPKKQSFVLWVANNKVVYLKDWQVKSVYNYELLGDTYIVKLNRKFFKAYDCFTNEELMIEKEYSFNDLKAIAKSQDNSDIWFK